MTETELKTLIHEQAEELLQVKVGDMEKSIKDKFEDILEKKIEEYGGAKKVFDDDSPDEPEKFKSFGEQLSAVYRAGKSGGAFDPKLKAASGANEAIPSEGGFLVQSEFAQELIANTYKTGVLAPKCRRIAIGPNANGLIMNAVDETSRATGSRWGGIRAYWVGEADSVTKSKPKFRQIELKLRKLGGLLYATDELLADATALESVTREAFAEEFGFALDDAIINGDGAKKPLGVLNSGALVSQAKESGQTAATVVAENIINMWNRLPAAKRVGAEWYINQDVEPQLFQMYIPAGTAGVPVFMPPGNGLVTAPSGTLFGRPIVPLEQCAALGTVGDVIFANFKDYILIDKGGINASSSIHVRFVEDEMTFKFIYRVDGQTIPASPITAYKGSTTRSPFVALATRA